MKTPGTLLHGVSKLIINSAYTYTCRVYSVADYKNKRHKIRRIASDVCTESYLKAQLWNWHLVCLLNRAFRIFRMNRDIETHCRNRNEDWVSNALCFINVFNTDQSGLMLGLPLFGLKNAKMTQHLKLN